MHRKFSKVSRLTNGQMEASPCSGRKLMRTVSTSQPSDSVCRKSRKIFFLKASPNSCAWKKTGSPVPKAPPSISAPQSSPSNLFSGVKPSDHYYFFVILSPVGAYYAAGFNPVNILVEDHYVRAVAGGTGEAKTGGNYAASLKAAQIAKKKGFDQVLWLDGCHKKYIEEVGSMNMFFVYDDVVVTAPLTGSILKGVTRDSVMKLADTMGFRIEERQIAIDELVADIRAGKVQEAFGSGTAAVITPVGVLGYKDESFTIGNGGVGNLTQKLYDTLTGIQYGKIPDTFGWVRKIS